MQVIWRVDDDVRSDDRAVRDASPTDQHETIGGRLTQILVPYVQEHDLGPVYHPRAVARVDAETEVHPSGPSVPLAVRLSEVFEPVRD
jgi:hypothetical protein